MDFTDLTEEQKAKVAACKTPEEVLALAREEGVELSDQQLEQVSGGWGSRLTCPNCGDDDVVWDGQLSVFICRSCGYEFS